MITRSIGIAIAFSVVICLSPFSPLVYAEWIPIQDGSNVVLRAICFADNSNGWVIGAEGLVKYTYNEGDLWTTQNSGSSNDLNDLYFANALKGWVVGNNGTILYTDNAGVTWVPIHPEVDTELTRSLCAIYFVNSNEGWIVGDFGTILHTADSGKTWIGQYGGTSATLEDVYFVDSKNGWAVGLNGTVVHTTDGGNSWIAQKSGVSDFLYDVYFCNQNEGWIVGDNGTILHTSNGGSSWSMKKANVSHRLRGVYFADLNQGWIVGDYGTILHTMNSGEIWIAETSRGQISDNANFYDVSRGGTKLWIVGSDSAILSNSDALTAQTIRLKDDMETGFVLPHEPKISTGQLRINSKPNNAKVYINGKLLEVKTPVTIKNLIPGRYEVKVVKRNFGSTKKYVFVSENEEATLNFKPPSRNRQIGLFTLLAIAGGIAVVVIGSL